MFFCLLSDTARPNLFDLQSVASVFEGQNSKTYDTSSNLIKFLSLFPADILLTELMASKDQRIASLKSQAHNNFIEDIHRKEEQANFGEIDPKRINEMWNCYNYGSTKCNILTLLFGAFDNGCCMLGVRCDESATLNGLAPPADFECAADERQTSSQYSDLSEVVLLGSDT